MLLPLQSEESPAKRAMPKERSHPIEGFRRSASSGQVKRQFFRRCDERRLGSQPRIYSTDSGLPYLADRRPNTKPCESPTIPSLRATSRGRGLSQFWNGSSFVAATSAASAPCREFIRRIPAPLLGRSKADHETLRVTDKAQPSSNEQGVGVEPILNRRFF